MQYKVLTGNGIVDYNKDQTCAIRLCPTVGQNSIIVGVRLNLVVIVNCRLTM